MASPGRVDRIFERAVHFSRASSMLACRRMNPVQRGAALLFSVCAAVFVPRLGFAAEGPPAPVTEQHALRLQYVAPLECPDAEGFFSRVQARTQRVRLAAPDELADLVDVKIIHGPNGEIGTLE